MRFILFVFLLVSLFSCSSRQEDELLSSVIPDKDSAIQKRINEYVEDTLFYDVKQLTDSQQKMLSLLIQSAQVMDTLFAYQTYGDLYSFINKQHDPVIRQFVEINKGPWDRLKNNEPFVEGIEEKAWGANFYPNDMTKQEFLHSRLKDKDNPYAFIRRDAAGKLISIPYHIQFKEPLHRAADLLRKAATFSSNPSFQKYLMSRATALETDNFDQSDLNWLRLNNNLMDIVIGPIETYDDLLFRKKTAYSGFVMVEDKEWSNYITQFIRLIPQFQKMLPVPELYRQQKFNLKIDLNVYNILYFAGLANVGKKSISLNLPNGITKQQEGIRNLQFKNVIQKKFEKIMIPIANLLIVKEQRNHIEFNAFFSNSLLREIARGFEFLQTVDGRSPKQAIGKNYEVIYETMNDVVGLFLIEQFHRVGMIRHTELSDYYTSFIASVFRKVRFGVTDASSLSNIVRFNYFLKQGAFRRVADGTYKINFEKMHNINDGLLSLLFEIVGDGNKKKADSLIEQYGQIDHNFQSDLFKLQDQNIPVDLKFIQGRKILGLSAQ